VPYAFVDVLEKYFIKVPRGIPLLHDNAYASAEARRHMPYDEQVSTWQFSRVIAFC